MVSAGTSSVAAYEAYLEALAMEGQTGASGVVEGWERALEAHTRAVELDPGFALAHWGRALYWAGQLNITNIGAELSDFSPEEDLVNYLEAIDAATGRH